MTLRLATGPVSWGVDFADAAGNPPWTEVVDGAQAAGYGGLELGPLGYLPDDAVVDLAARGLTLTGGFVFEPLHDRSRRGQTLAVTRRTAARVAAAGGRYLVIIDLVSPGRASTAGRSESARRLSEEDRRELLRTVAAVAEVACEHGLRPLVHPHAGTTIEFADEIEPVLEAADLCLDTGHCAYAGLDPVAAYRRWGDHIPYLHLKDLDADRVQEDFWASVRAGAFRPLGQGRVDFRALLQALEDRGFDGWAVVEQDRAPGGDPVADLVASRRFLERLA